MSSRVLPPRIHRASRGRATALSGARLDHEARLAEWLAWIERGAGLRSRGAWPREEGRVEGQPEPPDDEPDALAGGVVAHHVLPEREARHAEWPASVHPAVRAALALRGIDRPYVHQARAMEATDAGRDVVVVTPTASGKSLCYAVPILSRCLVQPDARALLLYPTKALSLDQAEVLRALVDDVRAAGGEDADVPVSTFDGDTPADARRAVRRRARLVVTNPDMLHAGILPLHARWSGLFEGLTHVVLDEVHAYRGVFGSHVANVLRRLLRVAEFHGSRPRFIACSATIANPREHAERLLGRPVELVDDDGAPRGRRHFVLYNPPVLNPELGIRASALGSARRIASRSVRHALRTIAFATSRLHVEILARYLKDDLARHGRSRDAVEAYRGGHLPGARRATQRRLKEGQLSAVVATSALELGLDIGGLDVAVLCGYPGSIASTWQQAGRAGRRQEPSACVLVGRATPLDQFVMAHPRYLLEATPEHARLDPDNLLVQADHVRCAAFELPFSTGESFGGLSVSETQDLLGLLGEDGLVQREGATWHWTHETHPAEAVSLRAVTSDNFVVVDQTEAPPRVIAEVDFPSAPTTLHEKAIHLVGAVQHQVERLDYEARKAYVRRVECDYFTDAMTHRSVAVLESFGRAEGRLRGQDAPARLALVPDVAVEAHHGEVKVARKVVGFKKIKLYTMENLGYGDVVLPEHQMHATSFWVTLGAPGVARLAEEGLTRRQVVLAMTGAAHALRAVATLVATCDGRDLETALGDARGTAGREAAAGWFVAQGRTGASVVAAGGAGEPVDLEALERFEPTIFLYETVPGGTGLAPLLFEQRRFVVEGAADLVARCGCTEGCPACVGPSQELGPRARELARRLLELVASCLAEAPA